MMSKRLIYLLLLAIAPQSAFCMHIAEGFLPVPWAIGWWIVIIPFLWYGLKRIKSIVDENSKSKMLLAVAGAFVFILSSLKLPSVAGSSSHLTGIALGAILFGASSMSVLGFIVLIFQALLLAHGGLTTLGANTFSMAVVGAFVAVWVYKGIMKTGLKQNVAIFVAAFLSDVMIYTCTSFQLAVAFQSETAPLLHNLIKFMSVFAVTQLPLAVIEGIFTILAFRLIVHYSSKDLELMNNRYEL